MFHQLMCLTAPGKTSLGKLRQKGHKLKAYLGYIMKLVSSLTRPCLDIKVKGRGQEYSSVVECLSRCTKPHY